METFKQWIGRNPWPSVVALASTIAGVLGFVVWAPPKAWELIEQIGGMLPWEAIVATALATAGLSVSHFTGSVLPKRRDEDGRTIPPTTPPNREEGSADVETLVWVALVGVGLLASFVRVVLPIILAGTVAGCLAGCGSELRSHAAAVTIAHAALTSGSDAVMDARAAELDACTDEACLDAGEARWSPWVASLRLIVEAWETWRDAVVAGFALPDEGVAAAICRVALEHLLDLWAALADTLTSAGVTMPRGPAELFQLVMP